MAEKGAAIGSKMAISKGTTWGTATSVNKANAAVEYLSENFGFGIPEFIDDASVDLSWAGPPIYGNVNVSGSFRSYLRYTTQEFVLAQPLGSSVSSALAAGFRHKYTYTSNLTGVFATLAIDKGFSIHEYNSIKFSGYTITMQAGRPTEIEARALGSNNAVPATKNTTLASATLRNTGLHVLWNQMDMLVQTRGSGAPTAPTDRYTPSQVELVYDRPLASHYVMNQSREMIEPIIDGQPNATLRLTFPRYSTAPSGLPGNFFANAAKNNTALKVWLRAVGPTIAGTSVKYRLDLYAPNAFVSGHTASIGGPAAIPVEATLSLKSSTTVPTGLPSWLGTGGFAIGLTGAVTAAPF
jgi:hypothetical protein